MSLSDGEKILIELVNGIRNRHDRFLQAIGDLKPILESHMAQLDELKREVQENNSVLRSAITLIEGLSAKLKEVQTPEDLTEVINSLDGQTNALAAAVAANTPAEPDPGPVPEPTATDPPVE
jgi:chromosome segregation ATPase